MKKDAKKWMKLDNAAKIYPAAKRRKWTALFRVSAELRDPIDPDILEQALACTIPRFPSFAQRLRHGLFWYYLEHIDGYPAIQQDVANPCVRMDLRKNGGFMFRVRYYNRRIAVEFFHVLSDGTGGMCFLKTLVAEYLRLRYGADIPRGGDILDCTEPPKPEELEDAYLKYAKRVTRSRSEADSFYIRGTEESDDFINIITGMIPVQEVLSRAHEKGVTLTEYLTSVLILAIDRLQRSQIKPERRMKPIKICVPINLRKFYPTKTLRNFASYVNPGIEPRYGSYTFDEVLRAVHHYMGTEVTEKLLNAKITTNVQSERSAILRIMPLFVKNVAMKLTFNLVGDRKTSSSISNLGQVRLPDEMAQYVTRMDFILGPLSRNRVVCAAVSYNGMLMLNFTSTIRETDVEREFFRYLVRLGIHVRIESNQREPGLHQPLPTED